MMLTSGSDDRSRCMRKYRFFGEVSMYNKRELFFVELLRLVSYVVCLAGLSGAVSRAINLLA